MVEPINLHYAFTTPASIYDEEALTALELAGRTAHKTNEMVHAFNELEKDTNNHLTEQDKEIDDRMDAAENFMKNNITETTNNLLHQLKDEGRLEGVLESDYFVTPQMYGAVGDGVTDDTTAFQSAITNNKRVFVPVGNYLVKNLSIGNCEIIGVRGSNLLISGVITITNTYFPRIRNISFVGVGESRDHLIEITESYYGIYEGLSISCRNDCVKTGILLTKNEGGNGCYYQSFRSCVFSELSIGIKFLGTANAHSIDNSTFYLCDICVYIDGAENIRVTENTFQSFTMSGVKIDNTVSGVPRKCLIMGNYFEVDSTVANTTYVGDIDFSNNHDCQGNYVLANHYTWAKANCHIVNVNGENFIFDFYTSQESSYPNTLPGITSFKVTSPAYIQNYGGNIFHGSIMPVKNSDDNIDLYFYGKDNGNNGWRKVLTTGNSEKDIVSLPPISSNSINQYYGGYLKLGYDYTGTSENALTIDTNMQLIKRYNATSEKWEYLQKVEAGSTASRPTWKPKGYMYYDSTLNKPIWSKGDNTWVDATGTSV